MTGIEILLGLAGLLVAAGAVESFRHRRALSRIPIRVHVNGTRGKSSVTRLIAAALREAGIPTCAKTTGTLPRLILPDGSERPVFRPGRANVIEQLGVARTAVDHGARALVVECMALLPELQWLSEARLVRATHGVITNARPDHLDVMGPDVGAVARALSGSTPVRGKIFTAETRRLDVLRRAAADRGTAVVAVGADDVAAVTAGDLAGFSHLEHAENVALALAVCADLGVDRATALRGMHRAAPDPGALTEHDVRFFGRRIVFVNGFAANDPESTQRIWEDTARRHPEVDARIAVFNCRSDRPDRSLQLGRAFPAWGAVDRVVLMGTGTYLLARAAIGAGLDAGRLVFAEDRRVDEIFEMIVELVPRSALVTGMGNVAGDGLALARHFRNRETPREAA
jgi:poly-gamma-glutamate synthase PgsB/CapB